MSNAFFSVPKPQTEPVKSYAPGSPEREELMRTYDEMILQSIDIPMHIGGETIYTDDKKEITPPHDHKRVVGTYSLATKTHVEQAIKNGLAAKEHWANLPWDQRASIFLKAADLLAGPFRARMNAATMIAQSKNAHQAEIDASCEMIDFFRFNAYYLMQIYSEQPESDPGIWNRLEHRPLEGFIYAITPFNFTSIAANLCAAPAQMGNVVLWKPSDSQIYSAQVIVDLFKAAGLPDGVINVVYGDPVMISDIALNHREFSGLHFTGSTNVFRHLWKTIGNNIHHYRSYPRIVGETGGKDFIVAHESADPVEVATAMVRGSFEFQGQKCSASSRAYIPQSLWSKVHAEMEKQLAEISVGNPRDFSNFVNAVIHEESFDKITSYIANAQSNSDAEIVFGGDYDKSTGYFIHPTVIKTENPHYETMVTELFGPVLTVYVYPDGEYGKTLQLVDTSTEYALTGALFARERYAIECGSKALSNSAGNFYINDKPTGAVVSQQPFGGGRASGTNDKAGSPLNLLRWVSPRTIKETFVPAKHYSYPFLGK